MGYTKSAFKLLKLLGKESIENKSIIEYGSQDIDVDIEYLNGFIKSLGDEPLKLSEYLSNNYSRLSTKYLYDSIGSKSYDCIDINQMHNSLNFDLNYNLKDKYNFSNTYDIVTNFGTSEHIFNQYSCFENLHNLCNLDGLMIIGLPIQGYENHCFFNYHPTFFKHLADANKYEILYINYETTNYYDENDSKNIQIIFKKINNDDFVMPIQRTINQPLAKINLLTKNKLQEVFLKVAKIDLDAILNIAIFGTAVAGESAYKYSQNLDTNVLCFIDDFKTGNYKDTKIPIISYDEFITTYQTKIDLVIQGNCQNGDVQSREGFKTKLLEISSLISFKYD